MTISSKIKRALISVSDKTNLIPLTQFLQQQEINIIATGGTAKLLREHAISIQEISEVTGFPELLAGRVKTLHPHIFAGILARREIDTATLAEFNIAPIDLVIVNLYPFNTTIQKAEVTMAEAIENIDIGGVSLIRAAAKNYSDVTVITDPKDYAQFIELFSKQQLTEAQRFSFAQKAFLHTANYDSAIANYFMSLNKTEHNAVLPETMQLTLQKQQILRYGENPQQQAALYLDRNEQKTGIAQAKQWQGKALSFNNILDADAANTCVQSFKEPACVIVKHANPCGVATGNTILEAYRLAYRTDPTSAFGGIIAFNQVLDAETAKLIIANQFVEVIIAPAITQEALSILADKPNIRVLQNEFNQSLNNTLDFRRISGGFLIQEIDSATLDNKNFTIATERKPDAAELSDLLFAWKVVKHVKSNAIVYAKQNATLGIGAGQMSRIDSAKIAALKAQEQNLTLATCCMASDAFFPFRDTIDQAAKIGVSAIIQPGGSIRDEEIIHAANEHNIAMILTGIRHFKH